MGVLQLAVLGDPWLLPELIALSQINEISSHRISMDFFIEPRKKLTGI